MNPKLLLQNRISVHRIAVLKKYIYNACTKHKYMLIYNSFENKILQPFMNQ